MIFSAGSFMKHSLKQETFMKESLNMKIRMRREIEKCIEKYGKTSRTWLMMKFKLSDSQAKKLLEKISIDD